MKCAGRIALYSFVGLLSVILAVACDGGGGDDETSPQATEPAEQSPSSESLPDLEITDIYVDPDPIQPAAGENLALISGTTYEFRIEVTNNGPGDVPGNVAVRFDYQCTSDCTAGALGSTNLTAFVGAIAANQTKLTQPVSITPDARGTYKFTFTVDPDNIYEETDESDLSNVWESTLKVQ
jgi:hypothetical protein